MRIISGTHKGRKIEPPGNLPVRPTTDFAKTGLFNILNNYFEYEKISVLDLFCGTGNISFEFASRGAMKIDSVDDHGQCIRFIKENSEQFGFKNITTCKSDYFRFLEFSDKSYDLIFADPPYSMEGLGKIPEIVFKKKLLNINGWLVLEHSSKVDFSNCPELFDKRKYGDVNFSFFR